MTPRTPPPPLPPHPDAAKARAGEGLRQDFTFSPQDPKRAALARLDAEARVPRDDVALRQLQARRKVRRLDLPTVGAVAARMLAAGGWVDDGAPEERPD